MIKNILYIIIALLASQSLKSQEWFSFFESSKSRSEKQKINILLDSAKKKYQIMDIEASYQYANKALSYSNEADYSLGKAYSHFYIGQAMIKFLKFNTGLKHLILAEKEEYSKNDPLLMAEISIAYSIPYDYIVSFSINDAKKELKKGLAFTDKIENRATRNRIKIKAYNSLSYLYFEEAKLDSVYYTLKKINKIISEQNEIDIPAQQATEFYVLKGLLLSKKLQHDSAKYYLNKSMNIADKFKYRDKSSIYLALGLMAAKQKKNDSALIYYLKSLKNMEETGNRYDIPTIYYHISRAYRELKNFKKANEYDAKTVDLQDSFQSEKEYDDFSKTILNKFLLNQKEKEAKKNMYKYIFAAILSLLIILSIYYLIKKHKSAKKTINHQEKVIAKENEKNLLLEQKVNESFNIIIQLAKESDPGFLTRFGEVYPDFINALLKIDPKLQTSELTFCAYLYLNFSSKEIAQYTFVTPRAVQIRKNRLRKKLNILSDEDIYLWLKNLS
ncbi:helix-turn-helix transcriptional regulator [Chryseobacterium sp. HR92]|uniref:helix-turn-helix transcriptional regulator n=1 Tax=Chryseobacterium sp. HR92 TaxID=3094839 RepID=UPI00388D4A57|nr:tetratricopeptide repeat protein [Chryseobacterium sp. HR92]